jgi:ribonuclease HII
MDKISHFKKILTKKKNKSSSWSVEKEILNQNRSILAIDEAGRGALAGPLSVGGIYLTPAKIKKLERDNIIFFDSKILNHQERIFFLKIIKKYKIKFKTIMVSHKIIDKKGINQAFTLAVKKLISFFKPQSVLIDGLPLKGNFDKKIFFFVKGDYYLSSLAAASIVAKTTRDKHLIKIAKKYPLYLFEQHKGYGTKIHLKKIKKLGPTKIHRLSFIKKILTN